MINFPENASALPTYLYRKDDFLYKPYDVIMINGVEHLVCGTINMSDSTTEETIFSKIVIPLGDFINPINNYKSLGEYGKLKLLLDEADLNRTRAFFSLAFTQIIPQNITELNTTLNS